jgi:hypothetical protein
MDRPEYTSLPAALAAVPDPCQARGQRYPWPLLLTLVAAALGSGQRHLRATGQEVGKHAAELRATLDPPCGRLPSPSTLRRAVQIVDVVALEARVAAFIAGLPVVPPAPPTPSRPPGPAATSSVWSATPMPPF